MDLDQPPFEQPVLETCFTTDFLREEVMASLEPVAD